MDIPPFMLKKLYVKGSLKREGSGVAFKLKNAIAPAHLVGIDSVHVEGKPVTGSVRLIVGGNEVAGEDITAEKPLQFDLKDKAGIIIDNLELSPGEYEFTIVLHTKEVGPLTLTFTDKL